MATQDDVRARFTEAENVLQHLRRDERNRNLADGEADFRTHLVSFMALSQSCVSMVGLSKGDINNIVNKFSPDEVALFNWFRDARNDSLKGGVPMLKTRMEFVPEHEYWSRFPSPSDWHPAYHSGYVITSVIPRPNYGIHIYELEVNGALCPAIETCQRYLGLVHRFLQDPVIFGPGF